MKSIVSLILPPFAAAALIVCYATVAAFSQNKPPPSAKTVYNIQSAFPWYMTEDTASGGGIATGTTSLVSSPSFSGAAREFDISFRNSGGERYWAVFGADAHAANFTYDAEVYIAAPSDDIANLEFDMNQVMANGQTVIYGVQCDGYSGTWDYTRNAGTPENPVDQWLHSTAPCNPQRWTTNAWHHVQLSYSRDTLGNVTYKTITFDGILHRIDQTVPSAFALGWSQVLLTNFEINGLGGYGSATVYIDQLAISRW